MGDRGRAALVLGRLRVLAANDATAPLNVIIASTGGGFAYPIFVSLAQPAAYFQ